MFVRSNAAALHDAGEDAHGIEAIHYPNSRIMMPDYG
jgi:hypothetical protein